MSLTTFKHQRALRPSPAKLEEAQTLGSSQALIHLTRLINAASVSHNPDCAEYCFLLLVQANLDEAQKPKRSALA